MLNVRFVHFQNGFLSRDFDLQSPIIKSFSVFSPIDPTTVTSEARIFLRPKQNGEEREKHKCFYTQVFEVWRVF